MCENNNEITEKRTFDEERDYIEGLMNSRFNYYLLFSSFTFIAIANVKVFAVKIALLFVALVVSTFFSLILYRSYKMLGFLLKNLGENHPYTLAKNELEKNKRRFLVSDASYWMGVCIPVGIMSIYLVWLIVLLCNCLIN